MGRDDGDERTASPCEAVLGQRVHPPQQPTHSRNHATHTLCLVPWVLSHGLEMLMEDMRVCARHSFAWKLILARNWSRSDCVKSAHHQSWSVQRFN